MTLADTISQAYQKKWSYINSFNLEFNFDGASALNKIWQKSNITNDNLQVHIISVSTPQFTNTPIEVFQGDMWKFHNGRDEMYRFTVTFRDSDQMGLYRTFLNMYRMSKFSYFDDVSFNMTLYKDADYLDESMIPLFQYENVMIENVSQLDFNTTTENQIAEFSVGFKVLSPVNLI